MRSLYIKGTLSDEILKTGKYMSQKKIKIHLLPYDRVIESGSKQSLMKILVENNIFLRSDCGGNGICGKCKVNIYKNESQVESLNACMFTPDYDITVEIPKFSISPVYGIRKPSIIFPNSFIKKDTTNKKSFGIAVDLGTTSIAVYLCDITNQKVLATTSINNPQTIYGDDVMSRIGEIYNNPKSMKSMQTLVVNAIEQCIRNNLSVCSLSQNDILQMVVVGNPTMIHILSGVNPGPIGKYPYQPVFYESRKTQSCALNFKIQNIQIYTLNQISGFIGGDILAAAIAVDFDNQPIGTLLVDLGTNGELFLKSTDNIIATSCATGPAFEGASLSCGMQAVPGAIDNVKIKSSDSSPQCSVISKNDLEFEKAKGICASGVISAIAEFCRNGIIEPGGHFNKTNHIKQLVQDKKGHFCYVLIDEKFSATGNKIKISQKDIRAVQLGKSALITGIEFLLKKANLKKPKKIIIAGGFGVNVNKNDMITIGMLPLIDQNLIEYAGNAAGAGAVMILCDSKYEKEAEKLSRKVVVVDQANNKDFQNTFVKNLKMEPD